MFCVPCVCLSLYKLSDGSNVPNGIHVGGGSHLCNQTKDDHLTTPHKYRMSPSSWYGWHPILIWVNCVYNIRNKWCNEKSRKIINKCLIYSTDPLILLTSVCDMIKVNESDDAYIVVDVLAKKQVKFFCFILFSVLITRHPILRVLHQNAAEISVGNQCKNYQNWTFLICESFPLIISYMITFLLTRYVSRHTDMFAEHKDTHHHTDTHRYIQNIQICLMP